MATLCLAAAAFAGELVLKSPTQGSFLGLTNSIQFSITGAKVQVTVTATVTGPSGVTKIAQQFTPDADGKINDSIALNFSEDTPTGDYSIKLSASEPNNTYTDQSVSVKVDVEKPKFYSFSPNDGAFVRGIVKIRASILEANLKDWRVKVNGNDIPNNTGTTNDVVVDWDATNVKTDGDNTITIEVRDLANNSVTQTIKVTLDRLPPTITVLYPSSSTKLLAGTTISVAVDVNDLSNSSVDGSGIDVVVRRADNNAYITRVTRTSIGPSGDKTLRWVGRIRYQAGLLPSKFKLVVTAVDRAGNVATPQEVSLTIRK